MRRKNAITWDYTACTANGAPDCDRTLAQVPHLTLWCSMGMVEKTLRWLFSGRRENIVELDGGRSGGIGSAVVASE